ncbi:MAG TPA: M23 family metallopeptidase [Nitrospinaceae bacterium]|jgi:murein DD-endopeptidase MepM/ murein hydrolase activator NlpD|nr:M23 family metallopeptidase [Nitrospinaceae bacterium]
MPCHSFLKYLVFISFFFFTGCISFQYDPWPEDGQGVYHTVQKGQTLYRIANTYEMTLDVLQRANHISDPSKLKGGTRLWIPGARKVLQVPGSSKSPPRLQKMNTPPKVKPRKGFLIWPTEGILTSGFGMRNGRKHEGIDIAALKGTPIYSAASGEVKFSGWGPTGYGKIVIIKHKHHLTTIYAHNSKLLVKKGTKVKQGQKISLMGSTGRSTGPHLHFEVRNNTLPKDPIKYLPVKK